MTATEIISSGLLELYAAGMASPEEIQQVEAAARQYPEVATELNAIEQAMENYAMAEAVVPDAAVKEKLMQRIEADAIPLHSAPVVPLYPASNVWKYVAAASIILLVGSAILNFSLYQKNSSAGAELAAVKQDLQQQKELAAAMHNDMGIMTDKNAMPVSLKNMPNETDGAARVYWMQTNGDVYVDPSFMPQAPAGMQYQLWAIVDGKPVSGGMIPLNNGNSIHLKKMKSFGNVKIQAFAISLEKAGPEMPVPSKVMLMGNI